MSKNDKRADEIIEETMRELYGDLHKSEIRDSIDEDDFDEDGFEEFDEDDYEEISHRKAKKTHAAGYAYDCFGTSRIAPLFPDVTIEAYLAR